MEGLTAEGLAISLIGSSFLPYLLALFTRKSWSKTLTAVFVFIATIVAATLKEMVFGNISLGDLTGANFITSVGVILVTSQTIYNMFENSVKKVESAAERVREGGKASTRDKVMSGVGDIAKMIAAEQLAKQVSKVESPAPSSTSRIDEVMDRNYEKLVKLQSEGKFDEMVDLLLDENIEIEELEGKEEVFDEYESIAG